ncbi:MAG TPA: 3,4-dehydroadipyl-CoA semialdehyde dehydrogenase [Planctomycetes bacterium]|nr:3,4-dehydroadipyl-CoA semialdehyde dehydrogenase [Planctomycetota bacterium]
MKTLRSHVGGAWHQASDRFVPLFDPSSEEEIAQVSSDGIDFESAVAYSRSHGGASLRELGYSQRGELLLAMSKALHQCRDDLLELSILNSGVTRKDAKFDVDGATGTLAYYGYLGKEIGDSKFLPDGDGEELGRSSRFWGQHCWVARNGVAIHINAFNFPAWGFAEKAAAAILAGMPVISKPATSTALVTERMIEILNDEEVLPSGILSLVCGSVEGLLESLDGQDVVAFTGSSGTGFMIRSQENLLRRSVPVNIEADSLNCAVIGPDVSPGSETWGLLVREIAREITQKSGQKCTAVRRIFVPEERIDDLQEALIEVLSTTVTGSPRDPSVTMGALSTASQLAAAVEGTARLVQKAQIVHGEGTRIDGVGAKPGKGWFFPPTLLRVTDTSDCDVVHDLEVFAPVSTLLPYDGSAPEAACSLARGGGTLVSSIYSDDTGWVGDLLARGGSFSGRFYLGSEKMASQATGSGVALPQSQHGGPGRAGGGSELGAARALTLYMQRIALQGSRRMIEDLTNPRES